MPITVIILAITILVSVVALNRPILHANLLFNPYTIHTRSQYHRFLTSGFIHSGWVHLGFNMFTFFFFGQNVEFIYGRILGEEGQMAFLGLYLGAIVVSDLPSYFRYKHQPGYSSLGASGGVSAVVFASILFMPLNPICLYGFVCIPGFILGILYIIYSYYQGKSMSDNINHQAHLVGAGFGIFYSLVLNPSALSSFIEQIARYRIF